MCAGLILAQMYSTGSESLIDAELINDVTLPRHPSQKCEEIGCKSPQALRKHRSWAKIRISALKFLKIKAFGHLGHHGL